MKTYSTVSTNGNLEEQNLKYLDSVQTKIGTSMWIITKVTLGNRNGKISFGDVEGNSESVKKNFV